MTLGEYNTTAVAGDVGMIANGVYTTHPQPTNSGTAGSFIHYIAEHGTPADFTETARGVVIDPGATWNVAGTHVYLEGLDFNSTRTFIGVFDEFVNGCNNWILNNCRSIRAFYEGTNTISHTDNSVKASYSTFYNCYFWGNCRTDGIGGSEPDIVRTGGADSHHIRFEGGGFAFSDHDLIGIRGTRGDGKDYNSTLASRSVTRDVLIRNVAFVGFKHPYGQRGGAYNIWVDSCTVDWGSHGGSDYVNTTSNLYSDGTIQSSGGATQSNGGARFWTYRGGCMSFVQIANAGDPGENNRLTPIHVASRDNGVGSEDPKAIEEPILFAHLTIVDSYTPSIHFSCGSNAGGEAVNNTAVIVNSILYSLPNAGPDKALTWQANAELVFFEDSTPQFVTAAGAGIWGSVVGSSPTEDVLDWLGTTYTLDEATDTANVDKDKFDVDSSNASLDPQFVDIGAITNSDFPPTSLPFHRDLRAQNTLVHTMGQPVAQMADSGTNATSGEVRLTKVNNNAAGWFWPANTWWELDEAGRSLGDTTPPGISIGNQGRVFWMKTTGGTIIGPLECQTQNSELAAGSDNLTWDTQATYDVGTEIHLVDPTNGVYAGARAPFGDPGDPTPPPEPPPENFIDFSTLPVPVWR